MPHTNLHYQPISILTYAPLVPGLYSPILTYATLLPDPTLTRANLHCPATRAYTHSTYHPSSIPTYTPLLPDPILTYTALHYPPTMPYTHLYCSTRPSYHALHSLGLTFAPVVPGAILTRPILQPPYCPTPPSYHARHSLILTYTPLLPCPTLTRTNLRHPPTRAYTRSAYR
eukprot:1515167-Rhodomonas_salina.1